MEDDNSMHDMDNHDEDDPEHFVTNNIHLLNESDTEIDNNDPDFQHPHQEVDTGTSNNDTPITRSKAKSIASQVREAISYDNHPPKTIKEAILEVTHMNQNLEPAPTNDVIMEEEKTESIEITPMQIENSMPQQVTSHSTNSALTTQDVDLQDNQQNAQNIIQPSPSTSQQPDTQTAVQSNAMNDIQNVLQFFAQQFQTQMSKQQEQFNEMILRQNALNSKQITPLELQYSREDHAKIEQERKQKEKEEQNKFHSMKQSSKNNKKSSKKGKSTEKCDEKDKSHNNSNQENDYTGESDDNTNSKNPSSNSKNELSKFNSPSHVPKNQSHEQNLPKKTKSHKKARELRESDSDLGKYSPCTESSDDDDDRNSRKRSKRKKKNRDKSPHDSESRHRSSSCKKQKTDSKSRKNDSDSDYDKHSRHSSKDKNAKRFNHSSSSSGLHPSTETNNKKAHANNNSNNNERDPNNSRNITNTNKTPSQNRIQNNGQHQNSANKNNREHDQQRSHSSHSRGSSGATSGQPNNRAGGGAQGVVNKSIPKQPFYPNLNNWLDSHVSILQLAQLVRSINRHNFGQKLPLLCYRYNFGNTCSMRTPNQTVCYSIDRKHQFSHMCSLCFELFLIVCHTHRDDNCPMKRYFPKFNQEK